MNSYNFRYTPPRDPITNNVFPQSTDFDENGAQIYPVYGLGQCQYSAPQYQWNCPTPMMLPQCMHGCGACSPQLPNVNNFPCYNVPSQIPNSDCEMGPACCSKLSTQTFSCAKEKPCFCQIPSQPTVIFADCKEKCSAPTVCKEKPTVITAKFCPNCPCSKCNNNCREEEKECNPPFTILLKIRQGEEFKVEKISEKELHICQGSKRKTAGGSEYEPNAKTERKIECDLKKSFSKITVAESNVDNDSVDLTFLRKIQSSISETTIAREPKDNDETSTTTKKKRKIFVYNGPKRNLGSNRSQNSVFQSLGVSKFN